MSDGPPISSILCVLLLLVWTTGALASDVSDAESASKPIQLPPISVTPGRFGIGGQTTSLLELSQKEMSEFPLIDNDIFRAAQVFPGVVANDFSARFSIRGGGMDEILTRLDGLELYEPYHLQDFGGAISSVDLDLVGRADLLTGGFPAQYGDKLSGVYNITTRDARTDRTHVNVGIDLLNLHAILEGPLGKGSWLVAARRGYVDLILRLMGSEEQFNPRYTDLFFKLEQPITSRDTLAFESLLGWDENEMHEGATDLVSDYRNRLTWIRWRRIWAEPFVSDLFLFMGDFDQHKREGDWLDEGVAPLRLPEGELDQRRLRYFGWQIDLAAALGKHSLKAGLIARWAKARYDYYYRAETDPAAIQANIDLDDWAWDTRGYLQDEWQVTGKLALNGGLRMLYQRERDAWDIGPRLMLAFRPADRWVLRAGWGIYHQPVDRLNIPVQAGQAGIDRPERAEHWVLNSEYQVASNTFVRAEAYYKPMRNLVGFIRDAGRKNQLFTVPDEGRAWGIEGYASRALSDRLSLTCGYAYAVAEASQKGQTFPKDTDQRHTFALMAHYALSDSLTLLANWRFHTGNPYTESTFTYDPEADSWQRTDGKLNGRRLPPYHSLDLRLTKRARYRSWSLQWYFQILNLYSRKNAHEIAYDPVVTETGEITGYERVEEGLLPIVPTLGLEIRF